LTDTTDVLAVEEPLEIRLVHGPTTARQQQSLAITMRTPGDDPELALGFLLSEGLIRRIADVQWLACGDDVWNLTPLAGGAGRPLELPELEGRIACPPNTVTVGLAPQVEVDRGKLQRHFYMTSSCGLCGKSSLAALEHQGMRSLAGRGLSVAPQWVAGLPAELRRTQRVFSLTGGLHAAGLWTPQGPLQWVREDVGRHNALDKLVGRLLLAGQWPAREGVLVVSGRLSFELVQKAVVAQIPVVVAIGAASSLAVQCAERFGVTLIGFASDRRFNCFSHPERVQWPGPECIV
jgi:FdhD protein